MPHATGPLPDLVEECFDEATFLLGAWSRGLSSLTRSLDEVRSWTEDRLHGALDGVRVSPDALIALASQALDSKDRWRVVTASAALASCEDSRAPEALALALANAEGDSLDAMLRGLELCGSRASLRAAAAALATRGVVGAGALCRLKAFHRAKPGDELQAAFASTLAPVQIEALRAAMFTTSPDTDRSIASAVGSDDPAVRMAAIEAGTCRGVAPAWDTARRLASPLNDVSAPVLGLMGLLGNADDHEVVFASLRVPALQKAGLRAAGHVGTVRAVEACLAGMRYEPLARAAGEAYSWITGADLVRDRLERSEPAAEAPALEDDDLNAELVPAIEDAWPLPDADRVRQHWAERSARFAPDVRHIHGRPVTGDVLLQMIESGPMVRRQDLIFELRARTRGRYDVEPRAFSARQHAMMQASRAAIAQGGR